jgi:hypothetical protein
MNHDELLAEIDSADEYNYFGGKQISSAFGPALRAVVELHERDVKGNCDICTYITNGGLVAYPCFTIQAIEKELA